MPDSYYLSSIQQNTQTYKTELDELHRILSKRNLSVFEYRAAERSSQH